MIPNELVYVLLRNFESKKGLTYEEEGLAHSRDSAIATTTILGTSRNVPGSQTREI